MMLSSRSPATRPSLIFELPEPVLHRLGDGDGIGAAFLVDGDLDAFLTVDPGNDLALFVPPGDARDILESNHGTALVVDDDVSHVGGSLELVDGADQVLGLPVLESSPGQVDVLLSQPSR